MLHDWSIGVLEYWSIGVYVDTKKTNLEGWLNIDIDSSRFNFRCLLLKYGIIYNAKNIKVCFLVYAVSLFNNFMHCFVCWCIFDLYRHPFISFIRFSNEVYEPQLKIDKKHKF